MSVARERWNRCDGTSPSEWCSGWHQSVVWLRQVSSESTRSHIPQCGCWAQNQLRGSHRPIWTSTRHATRGCECRWLWKTYSTLAADRRSFLRVALSRGEDLVSQFDFSSNLDLQHCGDGAHHFNGFTLY